MEPLLQVEHLVKRYAGEEHAVVSDVSLSVQTGEVFVLLGPSGCGKTTTLRLIAGFERADAGVIQFDGRTLAAPGSHLRPEQRGIGFVFQDYALFPHLTVQQNVEYGLQALDRKRRSDRAAQVLRMVGLQSYKDRKPHELSGGQQQRIALARSIAPSPKLLLLDEPFSNLDAALRTSTRAEVRDLLRREGMSALLVTHDQEEALSFGDRMAVMRGGRIEQQGKPEQVYLRPQTPFVAGFLGRTNLVKVQAQAGYAQTPFGRVRLNRKVDGEVLISVRPEHLRLEAPQPGFPRGRVLSREYRGHDLTFHVHVDHRTYSVHTDYKCPFEVGDEVRMLPRENAVVVENVVGHKSLHPSHAESDTSHDPTHPSAV